MGQRRRITRSDSAVKRQDSTASRPSGIVSRLSGRQPIVIAAVLALLVSLPSLFNSFAHDDVLIIVENARVHSLSHLSDIFAAAYWPPPYPQDLYRPLTSLLLALQWFVQGGEPTVFRVVSGIGYSAATVAVFALARRLLPIPAALAAALFFAVHPVHVEAVALGVNQAEIAVAILAATILVRYIDARRRGALTPSQWAMLSALFAAAALFKESALVIPFLLIAAEWLLVDGEPWRIRVRRLSPGYAVIGGVAIGVVLLRTHVLGGQVVGTFTAEALIGLGMGARALTMLQVVPQWLRLLVWPAHLRVDYSPGELLPAHSFGAAQLTGLIVLVVWFALIWLSRRRAPVVAFGLLFCAIALLPVSNVLVPTGILMAERTLFLPSVGFLLAAVAGVVYVLREMERRQIRRVATWRNAVVVAASGLLLAGAARSMQRFTIWRSNRDLWIASVADAPKSWRVQNGLAGVMLKEDRLGDGIVALERAIDASPEPWSLRNDLARILRGTGDTAGAHRQLSESLKEQPNQPDAQAELVAVLLAAGAYHDAKDVSVRGRELFPTLPVFTTLSKLADSAIAAKAPPGSIEVGVRMYGP
jgi:hypothetical protein